MLVTAENVKMAYDRIHESLNNMLVTFVVPEVKESPILEVFHHFKDEEKLPEGKFKPVAEVEEQEENEEDL